MNPVDDYVAALPKLRAERVRSVVALVRELAPTASEAIEYKMSMFRHGTAYFGVANQKNYVSLYLGGRDDLTAQVVASDPKLKGGKGCVNVADRIDMPLGALRLALTKLLC